MKNFFCDFQLQVTKIKFLETCKSHLKKIDDFQYTKLKFLVNFKAQNEIFIVEFFVNLGPLWKVELQLSIT